jgi:4-amino-4-deoxy-L-arabinose transferase-like glycosyltransferase
VVGLLERRSRLALAVVVVVALGLRLGALAAGADYEPRLDSADYDRHARSIAAGDGFPESTIADGGPSAFRPPLYPYLLGGVYLVAGDSVDAGRVFSALLGTLIVLGAYLVAREIWGRLAGLVAAALAAVFPPLVLLSMALISEPLFISLELGVIFCALVARRLGGDWRWALAAGALCGLAALTRSNGALLAIPAALGVWVVSPRLSLRGLVAPAVVLATSAIVAIPWAVRNAIEFDHTSPLNTQTGYGLAGAFNDEARNVDGYTATWVLPEATERYGELLGRRDLDERELDAELRRSALSFAGAEPGFVAEGAALNLLRTFHALGQEPGATIYERVQLGLDERTGPIVTWSVRALDVLAVLAILLLAIRDPRLLGPWFVWLAPVLMVGAAVWVLGSTRYSIPAYPFMLMLVGAALLKLLRRPLQPSGGGQGRTG